MLKRFCDYCGREIQSIEEYGVVKCDRMIPTRMGEIKESDTINVELCAECYENFRESLWKIREEIRLNRDRGGAE